MSAPTTHTLIVTAEWVEGFPIRPSVLQIQLDGTRITTARHFMLAADSDSCFVIIGFSSETMAQQGNLDFTWVARLCKDTPNISIAR